MRKAFSLGELIPQLIAMAFNDTRASEIKGAVDASGIPYTFVRPKFFERSPNQAQNNDAASNHEVVKILSRIAKLPVVYVDVPENIARQSMRQLGMPAALIEGLLQHRSAQWRSSACAMNSGQ